MAGWIHLRVNLIKDGVKNTALKTPYSNPAHHPKYDDYLIFEGISVDEKASNIIWMYTSPTAKPV